MTRKKNPNNSGTVSKIKRTKNGKTYEYWQARFSVAGKQECKTFHTQAEAQEFLNNSNYEVQNEDYLKPNKITVDQWFQIWFSEYCGDKKPLTLKHYRAQYQNHIKPKLGARKLWDLNNNTIQSFYNELNKSGKVTRTYDAISKKYIVTKSGLSPKSIRNIHGILTKSLNVAVRAGKLKNNPAINCVLPRLKQDEMHPLDKTQIRAFQNAAANDEYRFLLRILPFTGLRLSEAIGLTWDCINFRDGTILINKQLIKLPKKDGGCRFDTPKNGKTRLIKPAPYVMKLLKEREDEQKQDCAKAGDAWQGYQNEKERQHFLVFTTSLGNHLSPQTVYNHAKKVFAQIGITDSCVHDLRHTYAVLSIQAAIDIKTISNNLGHATVAFTLDKYGHVTDSMRNESSSKMQALIDSLVS